MPGDPKECREQANQCLELASKAPSPLSKARFEELAQNRATLGQEFGARPGPFEKLGRSHVSEDRLKGNLSR